MIQRLEERRGNMDCYNNFEAQYSNRYWNGDATFPVLDIELSKSDPQFLQSIKWPGDADFAACLTHDVDSTQHFGRQELRRWVRNQIQEEPTLAKKIRHLISLAGLRRRPSMQDLFTPWLAAEKVHDFRSTFFVFPNRVRKCHPWDVTYKWTDLMPFEGRLRSVSETFREIADRGWEVGIHGSIYSAFDSDLLAEQRQDISSVMGRDITAGRFHNLQFEVCSTPDHIAASGIQVDSTLGSNRAVFFRTGSSYPTPLWSIQKNMWLPVVEVPLILHDGALMRRDNLDLEPAAALEVCKMIIDRVAAVRGVVTLLWHPENIVMPGYFETYVALLSYIKEKNGWGAGATAVANWWNSSGNAGRHAKAFAAAEN